MNDPSVSDVTYTTDELAFLTAIDTYKRANNRRFPTWREVLAIVHALGYRRVADPVPVPRWKDLETSDPCSQP